MKTHYAPDPLPNAPPWVRKARCGRVYTRIGFDPQTHPRQHDDGTPYGVGSSNRQHVTCRECLEVQP